MLTAKRGGANLADASRRRRHATGSRQTSRQAESQAAGGSQEAAGSRRDGKARATCRSTGRDGSSRPAPEDPNADLVYGAYQRGQYKTAFDLASKRAQDFSDPRR